MPATVLAVPRLRHLFWVLAIGLATLQAWIDRHAIDVDGLSYSDMGDALIRGDWDTAINGYWSPLYPLLLGAAEATLQPTAYWAFTVVHLVNLVTFVASLFGVDFLLRQLARYHAAETARSGYAGFPDWFWVVFGYSLFLWASLGLIGLQATTPDFLVAAAVYVAAGLIVRIRMGHATVSQYTILGLTLGLGYLAKAVMFPLAMVFLAVAGLALGNLRKAVPLVGVACLAFMMTAAPWMGALSSKFGHWTFGESGPLAYAWSLDAARRFHAAGDEVSAENFSAYPARVLLERTRRLRTDPTVHEFAGGGTYPVWYDPSRWNAEFQLRFTLPDQLRLIATNLETYGRLFLGLRGGLALILILLVLCTPSRRLFLVGLSRYWMLWLPALAAMGLYSLAVVYPRYMAPFVVLVFLSLFAGLRLPPTPRTAPMAGLAGVAVLLLCGASMALLLGADTLRIVQGAISGQAEPNPHATVAETLKSMGLQAGDRVAGLRLTGRPGITLLTHSKWARLAGSPLIAEILSDDQEASAAKLDAIAAVHRAGAVMVVAQHLGNWAGLVDWQPIGRTGYFAYFLPR